MNVHVYLCVYVGLYVCACVCVCVCVFVYAYVPVYLHACVLQSVFLFRTMFPMMLINVFFFGWITLHYRFPSLNHCLTKTTFPHTPSFNDGNRKSVLSVQKKRSFMFFGDCTLLALSSLQRGCGVNSTISVCHATALFAHPCIKTFLSQTLLGNLDR